MSGLLPLLLVLAAPARPASAPRAHDGHILAVAGPEQMEKDVSDFEADLKEAEALLASLKARRGRVAQTADLAALEAAARKENAALAVLVDRIYRRRNWFRMQTNGQQVAVVAAQVSAGRADRAEFDRMMRYRAANERMTEAFTRLEESNSAAISGLIDEVRLEKGVRRKALALRRALAAFSAVALLLAAAALLRRRGRQAPAGPERPQPLRRPPGPARLE